MFVVRPDVSAQGLAQRVELMRTGGVLGALAKQAVGELLAVVRQQRLDLEP